MSFYDALWGLLRYFAPPAFSTKLTAPSIFKGCTWFTAFRAFRQWLFPAFAGKNWNIPTLSQLQLVVARALHGLPAGGASLHGHVAVGGVFLGNAHGAGV